jgi:hypothetical protein
MAGVALVVDAANVVGSRPDGWWRDRPGAAARLMNRLATALTGGALDGPVVVVLEGAARAGAPAGTWCGQPTGTQPDGPTGSPADGPTGSRADGPVVVHAERDGDSTIVAEVAAMVATGTEPTVVTADRALRERVIAAGGRVVGPGWLLERLV